jgi:ribosomal protein S13
VSQQKEISPAFPYFSGVHQSKSTRNQDKLKIAKRLILYGFTEEQAELLLQSVDEFVEEEKGLTEEAKESLYKG